MYILLTIVGIALSFLLTAFIYRTIESGKLIIYSFGIFMSVHVLGSGLLIWTNAFNLLLSVAVTDGILLVMTLISFLLGRKKEKVVVKAELKKYIPIYIIMLLAGILVSYKMSGFYALSQDQGFYQARAMFYMGEKYDNNISFPEINNFESQEAADYYRNKVQEANGGTFVEGEGLNYCLRGLGSFPSQLALFGSIFGRMNMNRVTVIFYVMTIGIAWIICDNLSMKRTTSALISVLMAVCPMIVWSAKNTLCEAFLMMIIGLFIGMLTDSSEGLGKALSLIPISAYCFYHLSVTILMPAIVLVYIIVYLYEKKGRYLLCSIAFLGLYVSGQAMMSTTSNWYWYCNLDRIFSATNRVINENNFVSIVLVCSLVYAVLVGILYFTKLLPKMAEVLNEQSDKRVLVSRVVTVILTILAGLLFIKSRGRLLDEQETDCLSMFGVLLFTEYIIVPSAIVSMFIWAREYAKSFKLTIIRLLFFYCMIVMYIGVYGSMRFYFYYGRYLVPFLLIMYLAATPVINKVKFYIAGPVLGLLAVSVMYLGRIVYTERDVTICDYQVVYGITDSIPDNSAVIIIDSNFIINRLMMPVRALTSADIYFADYSDNALNNNELDKLSDKYDNIYMLVYDDWYPYSTRKMWECVYEETMENSSFDRNNGLPLPIKTTVLTRNIGLFKLDKDAL